jgi:hypothetical protein
MRTRFTGHWSQRAHRSHRGVMEGELSSVLSAPSQSAERRSAAVLALSYPVMLLELCRSSRDVLLPWPASMAQQSRGSEVKEAARRRSWTEDRLTRSCLGVKCGDMRESPLPARGTSFTGTHRTRVLASEGRACHSPQSMKRGDNGLFCRTMPTGLQKSVTMPKAASGHRSSPKRERSNSGVPAQITIRPGNRMQR